MIIAFEGLDGAGKETQARRLADSLHQEGFNVFTYSFPAYQGPFYDIYCKITGMELPIASKNRLIQHLFAEDMNRVMAKTEEHKDAILILDRYFYSTLAYGHALGVDYDVLYKYIYELPSADLVFYLRLDASDSRVTGHFAHAIQHQAANTYDELSQDTKWVTINATDGMKAISIKCIQEAKTRLQNA